MHQIQYIRRRSSLFVEKENETVAVVPELVRGDCRGRHQLLPLPNDGNIRASAFDVYTGNMDPLLT